MNIASGIELAKTVGAFCLWPIMIVESWGVVPSREKKSFAKAVAIDTCIFALFFWLAFSVESLWAKIPLTLIAALFYFASGFAFALALVVADDPNYEDY